MEVFQWNKNFETGVPEVDQQHHRLVEVTNELGALLSQTEVEFSDVTRVYDELISYAEYHFTEEERLMTSVGVDSRFIAQQEQEHQGFLREISQLKADMCVDDPGKGLSVLKFLMNWLAYHILGTDMSMGRQVTAIKAGGNAAEVYLDDKQDVDTTTESLLKALNNLFLQVSTRNRQLVELNQTLELKVEQRTQALTGANLQLEKLASTDVLTGLPNRRHAMQRLAQFWEESTQGGTPLACMMIDADGFKSVNDTYGHAAGDRVLQELANQLQDAVRNDDVVCRLGGDEFLIICPDTSAQGVLHVAELTHARITELHVPVEGGGWQGSISVGAAVRTGIMKNQEELIRAADRSVYAAKSAGRNCVRLLD